MSTPADAVLNALNQGYNTGTNMLQARRQNAMRQILGQIYNPPQTQTQQVPQVDTQGNPVPSYVSNTMMGNTPIAMQNVTSMTPGGFDWQKGYQLAGQAGVAPEMMAMQAQSPELAFQKMMAEYQLKNWMQNQSINNMMGLMQRLGGSDQTGAGGMSGNPYGPAAMSVGMTPTGPQFTFDPSKAIAAEGQMGRGNAAIAEANYNTGASLPFMGMPGQQNPQTSQQTAPVSLMPVGPPSGTGLRPAGMSPKDWSELQRTTRGQRTTTDYAAVDKLGTDLSEKAAASADSFRITSIMRDLLTQFTPGKFTNAQAALASYAQSMGYPKIGEAMTGIDPNQTGAIQAFNKLTAQLVSKQIKETSNRMLQTEFNIFLKNNPNPEMTPQAMSTMLGFLDRASKDNLDSLNYFNQWRHSPQGMNGTVTDFTSWNTNRLMQKNKPQLVNETGQAYPTATNPQTGERIILKDGQWQPLR